MRLCRTLLPALVVALSLLSIPGCVELKDVESKRTEIIAQRTDIEKAADALEAAKAEAAARQAALEEQLAEAQARLEDAEDEATRRSLQVTIDALRTEAARAAGQAAQTDVEIAGAKLKLAAADAAVKTLDAAIAEYKSPTDPLNQAVQGALPFLPEPVRLPLAWGATIGALLWRSKGLKNALTSVIKSVEALKSEAPSVAAAMTQHAKTIRKIQTPTARKIVDQVQSGATT
jgi:TolA-binding protein